MSDDRRLDELISTVTPDDRAQAEQLMIAKKAEAFMRYKAAICYCVLTGATGDESVRELASLLMVAGDLYWTRVARYQNPTEQTKIHLIQVLSDGKMVKEYAERRLILGRGDILHVRYSPSQLWNSSGSLGGQIVSDDGRILNTFRTAFGSE